uniref:Peptidase S1 domain-containing protein n=1 Tax=Globodera pallida TaxID=36090 RepID=A0A183C239_GLOPA
MGIPTNPDFIFIHPLYQIVHSAYDAALLRISPVPKFDDFIWPICLPTRPATVNGMCVVTGWGRLAEGGKRPTKLREIHVPVMRTTTCNSVQHYSGRLHYPSMICAGFNAGKSDACQGDSGGPLQCQNAKNVWELQGIVSWGIGCANPKFPGVYTKMFVICPWVRTEMRRLKTLYPLALDKKETTAPQVQFNTAKQSDCCNDGKEIGPRVLLEFVESPIEQSRVKSSRAVAAPEFVCQGAHEGSRASRPPKMPLAVPPDLLNGLLYLASHFLCLELFRSTLIPFLCRGDAISLKVRLEMATCTREDEVVEVLDFLFRHPFRLSLFLANIIYRAGYVLSCVQCMALCGLLLNAVKENGDDPLLLHWLLVLLCLVFLLYLHLMAILNILDMLDQLQFALFSFLRFLFTTDRKARRMFAFLKLDGMALLRLMGAGDLLDTDFLWRPKGHREDGAVHGDA